MYFKFCVCIPVLGLTCTLGKVGGFLGCEKEKEDMYFMKHFKSVKEGNTRTKNILFFVKCCVI